MNIVRRVGRGLIQGAHQSGLAPWFHRARNRNVLTTLGLHRVLPDGDPRWAGAMQEYTVGTSFFERLLDFLQEHYRVVSLDDVLTARDHGVPLPPHPLLLTFDDGWADTADVALPLLEARGLPAVVFMVADRVGRTEAFWQTEWWAALSTASTEERSAVLEGLGIRADPGMESTLFQALDRLDGFSLTERWSRLRRTGLTPPPWGSRMMDAGALRAGSERGLAVGAHGYTHEPLTRVDDLGRELEGAREGLHQLLGETTPRPALSFPHGRYGPGIVAHARRAGFRLMFTSETVLTPLLAGAPASDVLGRVWAGRSLADARGSLDPVRAAARFFLAPVRLLDGTPSAAFRH